MGLQLADAAAGAVFNALERDRFGNTEPRYLKILVPILYRRNGEYMGYGFKVVPQEVRGEVIGTEGMEWLCGRK